MQLVDMHVSSLVKCQFKPFMHLNRLLVLLRSSLYILDSSSLSYKMVLKIRSYLSQTFMEKSKLDSAVTGYNSG